MGQVYSRFDSFIFPKNKNWSQIIRFCVEFFCLLSNHYYKTNRLLKFTEDALYIIIYELLTKKMEIITTSRGYFSLKLSLTSRCCPWWLIFFKNLLYQNNCKETMNLGGGQIRGAIFNFFVVKKCPFFYLPDAVLVF